LDITITCYILDFVLLLFDPSLLLFSLLLSFDCVRSLLLFESYPFSLLFLLLFESDLLLLLPHPLSFSSLLLLVGGELSLSLLLFVLLFDLLELDHSLNG